MPKIGAGLFKGHKQLRKASPLAILSSLAGMSMGASSGVAIQRGITGVNFNLFMHLSGSYWLSLRHEITSPKRASWRSTNLIEAHKIYRAVDASAASGTWNVALDTSGSSVANSNITGRSRSTVSSGGYIDIVVSGEGAEPYDVKVSFVGRTAGAYCVPYVNGSQSLIDSAIVDPTGSLGVRAFSTYNATNLSYHTLITIAKGLTGTNTIRLQQRTSSYGTTLQLEAVAITSNVGIAGTLPPDWVSKTYVRGDEIHYQGMFYRCSVVGGGNSTIAPTSITDGATQALADGYSWRAFNENTYQYFFSTNLDYQSEREYHIIATVNSVDDDIGGQTHGSDNLVSRSILLDGVAWDENGSWSISTGSKIELIENSTFVHPQNATLANSQCSRLYVGGAVNIDTEITWLGTASLRSYYVGMMPALKNTGSIELFTNSKFNTGANFTLASYAGAGNAGASGEQSAGQALAAVYIGSISSLPLATGVVASLETLKNWGNSGSRASVQPNVGGVSSGYWQSKTYITRAYTTPEVVANGDVHKLSVTHAFGMAA